MTEAARKLLELLDIERLEVDMFRGFAYQGQGGARIFGGHVIAQALMAAYRTVPDRACHSLHAYFIRPGDPEIPIIYQVDRARDGGSFTTRRVVAIQHGKQILNLSASFQIEEAGWDYQHPMPDTEGPENLTDQHDLRAAYADRIPKNKQPDFLRERPIDVREVAPRDLLDPVKTDDRNHLWFRMPGAEGQPPEMQHCLLAYASDMSLLGSSLRPHGLTWLKGNVMSASLDHAMWFHTPIQFEDWHLYALDAPFTGGARGFNRGLIYDRAGRLVASVAQEGLVRPVTRKA
ncbi:acyl-CoA thioesterase [Paracoccus saliphilus]|uniref:Acyl-CoA thioesterase 2 n=1 Tax=Paracoccus saliphilus TaxID=405559 RepID=A0AA45W570_9RHOB|nr:acyl-CoA thioesterase II [Paracoccus saliphilus]WCR02201.1 acyl-CoA thioesterase II [Paracoccus saliphilus]SIS91209.1 acyl-CoA thioesterase-2 [Paracoccus saliphilus]